MKAREFNSKNQTGNGPRPVPRTGTLFCFIVFLSIGGVSACVSQGKYETLVLENHALRQENSVLRAQSKEIQLPQLVIPEREPTKPMSNRKLSRLLGKMAGQVEGQEGAWNINYRGIPMAIFTSPPHDRMRIVSPIPNGQVIQPSKMTILLKANFDRALDARYALYQGRLWSVYLHPLSSLTEDELKAALDQVANLVKTYGSTYSSGHLQFGNLMGAD